jgi:hypothetical protein
MLVYNDETFIKIMQLAKISIASCAKAIMIPSAEVEIAEGDD